MITEQRGFLRFWNQRQIAMLMLLMAFVSSSLSLFLGTFVDEHDNIASARLVSQGFVLYRDVFSHHFPFPYYWLAFVFRVFGNTVLAARFSVLVFHFISFALAMRLSRLYIPVGLVALVWSIIAHFYFGNMAVYDSFSGPSLLVLFSVTLSAVTRIVKISIGTSVVIGIFTTMVIFSDPLLIYPVTLCLLALGLSGVDFKRLLVIVLILGASTMFYLLYLGMSGAFTDFYRDAIVFNVTVYSKYVRLGPYVMLSAATKNIFQMLNIADPRWWNVDPLLPLVKYHSIDQWLFTGWFYRFSIIATSLFLVRSRNWLGATFVYTYAAFLTARSEEFIHANAFVLTALLAAAWIVARNSVSDMEKLTVEDIGIRQRLTERAIMLFIRVMVGVMMFWLLARGSMFIAQNQDNLSYAKNFWWFENRAKAIVNIVCGRTDVALLYYPGEPLMNFLTGMRPASRYLFMWPWVAEVGIDETIHNLGSTEALVFLYDGGEVGGVPVSLYLAKLKVYLEENYQSVGDGFYVSPGVVVCR